MKKFGTMLLATALCLALLAGCANTSAPTVTQAPAATEAPTVVPAEAPAEDPAVTEEPAAEAPANDETSAAEESTETAATRVRVLNGTTGFGMAKLMSDAQTGAGSAAWDVTVETDASNITAALISGDCDIAALPTNAAAALYNKTQGGVQLLCLNTRGVLYLLANTEKVTVNGWEDLKGQSVYVPAQNPTFIFRALADAAGAEVTVDNTYAAPADLRTALAAGEVDLAVLPEPMVTIACAANDKLKPVMDLTDEWENVQKLGALVQGCAVVRTEFAQANPETVAAFLADYGASIEFLLADPAAAAALIEANGIFQKAAVAEKAIPRCNICFLTGEEMKEAMNSFCETMFAQQPASVGGAVPADDFYYMG